MVDASDLVLQGKLQSRGTKADVLQGMRDAEHLPDTAKVCQRFTSRLV